MQGIKGDPVVDTTGEVSRCPKWGARGMYDETKMGETRGKKGRDEDWKVAG